MFKWILVFWTTYQVNYGVLVQHYDENCKCMVQYPSPTGTFTTDTIRKEFKTKKEAIEYLKVADFTNYRIDSVKLKK